jgi:hypothetical protein
MSVYLQALAGSCVDLELYQLNLLPRLRFPMRSNYANRRSAANLGVEMRCVTTEVSALADARGSWALANSVWVERLEEGSPNPPRGSATQPGRRMSINARGSVIGSGCATPLGGSWSTPGAASRART